MTDLSTAFRDRVHFVTGAASGIGLELSRQITALGGHVVMSDRDGAALEAAAKGLGNSEGETAAVVADVSDADAVRAAREAVLERFGAVHTVFNNAGVGMGGDAGGIDLRDWRWIVDINLMGVVHGVEVFADDLKGNDPGPDGLRGRFVNTASMAGHMVLPGVAPYHATKFAVVGYSEALRMELERDKVGVTCLCPTFVQTRIHTTARHAPSAGGVQDENDPKFQMGAAMVANGMKVDTFVAHALRAIADNRRFAFNDPIMATAFDVRRDYLKADLEAGLADIREIEGET